MFPEPEVTLVNKPGLGGSGKPNEPRFIAPTQPFVYPIALAACRMAKLFKHFN